MYRHERGDNPREGDSSMSNWTAAQKKSKVEAKLRKQRVYLPHRVFYRPEPKPKAKVSK